MTVIKELRSFLEKLHQNLESERNRKRFEEIQTNETFEDYCGRLTFAKNIIIIILDELIELAKKDLKKNIVTGEYLEDIFDDLKEVIKDAIND